MPELLAIRDLRVALAKDPALRPVDGVDLQIGAGELVCLVGESGSGKSLTALSIMGLLGPGLRTRGGSIAFQGEDLLRLPRERLRQLRGNRVAMVFQEPMTSLNPVFAIGRQVAEPLMVHLGLSRSAALAKAAELLDQVGIRDARARLRAYPDELSGGQRQRVMIAMALACAPDLLIADEPTTALDVTIQAQILDLIKELQRQRGMAVFFITHDFDVVARIADRVAVMYAGQVVEQGPARVVLQSPRHPYTAGLLACLPDLAGRRHLRPIAGQVPALDAIPPGCRFAPRCPLAQPVCREAPVPLLELDGRQSRCLFHDRVAEVQW
ncbi:MAG: ABC transporter ATP-binding protein [Pseudomonadota bacterium]